MVGQHHRLNGHESEKTPEDSEGQRSLVCCSPWGRKESDTIEQLTTMARKMHGLPRWLSGKEATCQCRRHGFDHCIGKIPWRKKWQPTPIFLPEKSHGQRSLVGYSPWGRRVGHYLATEQVQYHNQKIDTDRIHQPCMDFTCPCLVLCSFVLQVQICIPSL